ncbi:hypothetical protein ACVMB3_004459 [Sinorhizobium meliloti]
MAGVDCRFEAICEFRIRRTGVIDQSANNSLQCEILCGECQLLSFTLVSFDILPPVVSVR